MIPERGFGTYCLHIASKQEIVLDLLGEEIVVSLISYGGWRMEQEYFYSYSLPSWLLFFVFVLVKSSIIFVAYIT